VRDIGASVEVRALIGADKLRELHGDALARYECWRCGRAGCTAEPTSVIVLGYRVFRVIKLAHAGCTDSQIIEVGAAGMSAVGGDLTHRHNASGPGEQAGGLAAARHPARGVPGMKTARLARRLDLDGNPLQRHTGKIAAPVGAEREVGNDE
jgi:hypothetical protein